MDYVELIIPLPSRILKAREFTKEKASKIQTIESDINYLAGVQGPVICKDLALCYWAGKPFVVDFFNIG